MMIITTIFLVSPVSLSQVIALICNLFVNLLMILCLLSTNWLTTTKYRQGLWQYCIDVDSPRPLPFGITDEDGCHWGREVGEFCWSFSFFGSLVQWLMSSSFAFIFPFSVHQTVGLLRRRLFRALHRGHHPHVLWPIEQRSQSQVHLLPLCTVHQLGSS